VDPIDGRYDHLFDEPANVRWYLADPLLDSREWAALIPQGLDLDGGGNLAGLDQERDRELAISLALRNLAEETLSDASLS